MIRLMNIVKNLNKKISFSPLLPSVASMLLLYCRESEAYYIRQAMINQDRQYFSYTKPKFMAMVSFCSQSIRKQVKKKPAELAFDIVHYLLPIFFTSRLDKNVALEMFDSFVYGGTRILVLYIKGALCILKDKLNTARTSQQFVPIIYNYFVSIHDQTTLYQLLEISSSFHLPDRRRIKKFEDKLIPNNHHSLGNEGFLPIIDFYVSRFRIELK